MAMEKTKLEILQHLGFLPKIDEVSKNLNYIGQLHVFQQCGLTKINETIRNEIKSEMIFNMESAPSISEQSCFARNVER